MPMLNFQKQFVKAVENGLDIRAGRPIRHPGIEPKFQTIRAMRKRPFKKDDALYLYTGARQKNCRKLGEEKCKDVQTITIADRSLQTEYNFLMDSIDYDRKILDRFAVKDGFKDWEDLVAWFEKTHNLPFTGQLIKW
jgi:hypothetical protein